MFKKEEGLDAFHAHLRNSFSNVKRDTSALFDWVEYLHEHAQRQESLIQQQNHTLSALHHHVITNVPTHHDVKQIIDTHFALQDMRQRLNHMHKKIEVMASLHDQHHERIAEIRARLENAQVVTEKKSSQLKEKLIKNLTKNSKAYVKNAIVGYVERYSEISALKLKELVVDEQQLCSKSSFYRLLQELEDSEKVSVLKQGKLKTYLKHPKVDVSRR